MIGMFHQNSDRPVNLLSQHCSCQPMRPGHRSERQKKTGFPAHLRAMPIGPANEKSQGGRAVVEVTLQQCREIVATKALASFIQRYAEAGGRAGANEDRSFRRHAAWRIGQFRFGEIARLELGYATGAAKSARPLCVVFKQFKLGPGLQPANGEDMKLHRF